MVHKYDNIDRKNGMIRGESNEYGVVSVPDSQWGEVENFEGNWEEITQTIIENAYKLDSVDDVTKLDYDDIVEILRKEDIVNYDPSDVQDSELIEKEERRKAELLLEFLVDEGIYEKEGNKVTILQAIEPQTGEYAKFNWANFLTVTASRFKEVVQRAKNMKEDISEYYEEINVNDVDPAETKGKLLEDLMQITGADSPEEAQPKEITADGRYIPPESVKERDIYEYKQKMRRLKAWDVTDIGITTGGGTKIKPEEQIDVFMDEIKTYKERFEALEGKMRKKSIPEIINLDDIQEDLQQALNVAGAANVLNDRSIETEDDVGDMLRDVAEESGHEVGSSEGDSVRDKTQTSESEDVGENYVSEAESQSDRISDESSSESGDENQLKDFADSLTSGDQTTD
jgi:hypothetical protein